MQDQKVPMTYLISIISIPKLKKIQPTDPISFWLETVNISLKCFCLNYEWYIQLYITFILNAGVRFWAPIEYGPQVHIQWIFVELWPILSWKLIKLLNSDNS